MKKKSKKELEFDRAFNNAERFCADCDEGLSEEQVAARAAAGLKNFDSRIKSKSYVQILRDNLCTYFNLIWAVIAAALIIVGSWNDLFFLAIITANIAIGIFQEIRAKRTLDKLTLVGEASVTVVRGGKRMEVKKEEVVLDDIMHLKNGQQITADCVLVDGACEVNESMLTGESVPVEKQVGSSMLAGSFLSSGSCFARVEKVGTFNYVETLMANAKQFKSTKSKMLLALQKLIKIIGIIIVPLTLILVYINFKVWPNMWKEIVSSASGSTIGMIPAGMYLLTSVALFTSFLQLAKKEVWVQELYSIEMLARVDVLCLDKTGTITDGTMRVVEVVELKSGIKQKTGDIMANILNAVQDKGMTNEALKAYFTNEATMEASEIYPFSSEKKYSGATFDKHGKFIVGAPEFVLKDIDCALREQIESRAREGLRVLLLVNIKEEIKKAAKKGKAKGEEASVGGKSETVTPIAIIAIEDHIRDDAPATLKWFVENNVTCKVISGDNPITVAAVAKKAGIINADMLLSLDGLSDDEVREAANKYTVFGRVSPEQKRILVKAIKAEGHTVAMTGDGVNDILALKESDCAVAMAAGSEAARNVAHLVLMDNNFSKMPHVVASGRRVVNNIERTTSVFLMKTIFTVLLSVIIAAVGLISIAGGKVPSPYPFSPNNLTIIEFAVIGIPSVVLAFQPNDSLIKGSFLSNVFKKSIAPGVTLLICYYLLIIIGKHFNIEGVDLTDGDATAFNTMSVSVFSLVGWFMLMRVCRPFNPYRALVCLGSMAIILVCIFGLGSLIFGLVSSLATEYYLFSAVVVFASVYIADLLNLGTDGIFKLFEKKKLKQNKI